MKNIKNIKIERTRSNRPALWERGGGYTNTGFATIVADPDGQPMRPIYVRRRGHLANGDHALFMIRPGCYVIRADHHRGDFVIEVFRILAIMDEEAVCELTASFAAGEWEPPLPEFLSSAVEAAKYKALCYHCREPHYCITT